jgi:adenylate cyclase class 2
MEEQETEVADPDACLAILAGLGFGVAFRYEKLREVWTLGGCHICLDTLPFGDFVEIEGPSEAIAAAAGLLGLARCPTSAASYHELRRECLAAQGLPAEDGLLFPKAVKARLMRGLGPGGVPPGQDRRRH